MSQPWTLAVDFGTTSTVAAMCDSKVVPVIVEVDGIPKMPSMVVVDDDHKIVVGVAATELARSIPHRAIRTPKNRLGDTVPIVVGGAPFEPVAFARSVLGHVLAEATRYQGCAPSHSRLTYPATWNRQQRDRLIEAAAQAGYPNPELVAEPIAAAMTHADITSLRVGDHVAVYDLGGGTFDTVVLKRTADGFVVVGQSLGDPQLGGELFDELLMHYVGEQLDPAVWDRLLTCDDTEWMRAAAQFRAACRSAKENLSSRPVVTVAVELPGGSIDVSIARGELEAVIVPFLDESIEVLNRCIGDAGLEACSIDAVYVTGGASRMPIVEERVRQAYPNTVVGKRGDPKVAVALGALLAKPGATPAVNESDEASIGPAVPKPPNITVPGGPATRIEPDVAANPK